MAQYQLPNDFFFGAAMSGPQTEGQWNQGGKLENLWDTWSIQDLGSFYNCVGSYAGNDFMAKYQEDFRILKDLGLNTYRTSIQWSRLLDADGNRVVSRAVPRLSRGWSGAVRQPVPL